MALDPVVNFFRSTIATLPVASGGTSIVITTGDGAKLPDPAVDGNFNLTIYNEDDPFDAPEIVRVTAIAGDTLTVTRAQEGTSATNKTSGNTWYLELTPTAKTIQDIDTAKLDVADVVNNLTSTDTDKALSANQGKVLQDGKLNLSGGTMTGDLTIPDKIIHSGDTNTYLQFTDDIVALLAGGHSVLTYTESATSTFTIGNGGQADITIGTGSGATIFQGGTEGSYVGNVGINTTTPATKLDVNGDVTITDKIIHSGDTNTAIRFPANDTVSVETSGVERLRILSSGEVGIGGVPVYALSVITFLSPGM